MFFTILHIQTILWTLFLTHSKCVSACNVHTSIIQMHFFPLCYLCLESQWHEFTSQWQRINGDRESKKQKICWKMHVSCSGRVNFCKWNKKWLKNENEHISKYPCNVLIYCCHYRYLALIQQAVAVSLGFLFFSSTAAFSPTKCAVMILVFTILFLARPLPLNSKSFVHKVAITSVNSYVFPTQKYIQFFISVAFLAIAFHDTSH